MSKTTTISKHESSQVR